jgi:transposase-like protein
MQKRQSELKGDRPTCPIESSHAIHDHGSYARYGDCDGDAKDLNIPRYLCASCGHTISVLPDDVLPYRAVRTDKVEKHFQARADGTPPPPATEKEKGCLKRAWRSFEQHVTKLTAVLGQIIARVKPNDGAGLWKQLRPLGNLKVILSFLANPFKTSLLRDYLCLQPWPAPE